MATVFEITQPDAILPDDVATALAEYNAIARVASDRITSRIETRRRASGCAIVLADSRNWGDVGWAEFYDEVRPAMRRLRDACERATMNVCDVLAHDSAK